MKLALQIAVDAYTHEAGGGLVTVEQCREAARQALDEARAVGAISDTDALEEWTDSILKQAHESVTNNGKSLLRKFQEGQLPLSDLMDAAILPIGEGSVLPFGYFDARAMVMADAEQFQNLEEVQRRYASWRSAIFAPMFPVLQSSGLTVAEAHAKGLL